MRKGIDKVCVCGSTFYVRPSAVRINNFCSRRCASNSFTKTNPKACSVCGVVYRTTPSQERHRGTSKYCSKRCKGKAMSIAQMGEHNPAWRDGVSTENHRLRQSKAFKDWRRGVFERDDYTCVFCHKRGGYLEPDHIKPFAYFPDLRFDVSNGRTLCKPCHKTTDTYGNKAKRLYGL